MRQEPEAHKTSGVKILLISLANIHTHLRFAHLSRAVTH